MKRCEEELSHGYDVDYIKKFYDVVHIKDFDKYYDKAVNQYLMEKGMTEETSYHLQQEQKEKFMSLFESDDALMSSIGIEYYADVIKKIMNEIHGEGKKICKQDMYFLVHKFKKFHDLFTRPDGYDGGKRRKTKITKKKKRSKITGARCCTRRSRRTSCRRGETAHRR